jgi:hypothetical protein
MGEFHHQSIICRSIIARLASKRTNANTILNPKLYVGEETIVNYDRNSRYAKTSPSHPSKTSQIIEQSSAQGLFLERRRSRLAKLHIGGRLASDKPELTRSPHSLFDSRMQSMKRRFMHMRLSAFGCFTSRQRIVHFFQLISTADGFYAPLAD